MRAARPAPNTGAASDRSRRPSNSQRDQLRSRPPTDRRVGRRKTALGRASEEFAAEWLRARGYRIVERNYRRAWGEADIIARDRDGTTVIVEVRSRSDARRVVELLESVDRRKQHQLRRLARGLLAERDRHVDIRVDVIAVVADDEGNLRVHSHIRNAVEDV